MPDLCCASSFNVKVCNLSYFLCIFSLSFYLELDDLEEFPGFGTMKPRNNLISSILGQTPVKTKLPTISIPHDFRQVSAIIDVDIVPETHRRVRLLKYGSDKPLGFYIR